MTAIRLQVQWHKNTSKHQSCNLLLLWCKGLSQTLGAVSSCLLTEFLSCLAKILQDTNYLESGSTASLGELLLCPLLQELHVAWAQLPVCLLAQMPEGAVWASVRCWAGSPLAAERGCWNKGCDFHSHLREPERWLEWKMWETNMGEEIFFSLWAVGGLSDRSQRFISDTNTVQGRCCSHSALC